MNIDAFKDLFAHSPKYLLFNNAGLAQIPQPALQTLEVYYRKIYEMGSFAAPDLIAALNLTRERLAELTGAKTAQVSLFPSTAVAISQVALGLCFSPGDEILTWDQEYPSNFYPWKVAADRAGAKLVVAKSGKNLETSAKNFLSYVTEKTKVIAFSWVQYRTGSITDLATVTAFAKQNNILTCADIIQGVGVMPFDFQKSGLDFACGGSHKFLCSPIGIGFLTLREQHILKLQPLSVGAFSFGTSEELSDLNKQLHNDIMRFEPGAKNLADIAAFGTTLELFLDVGIDTIHKEAIRLADVLIEGLEKRDYVIYSLRDQKPRSPHVTFGPSKKSKFKSLDEIKDHLSKSGAAFSPRPPGIRLSPHAFTRDEEIHRLLALL